MEENKILCDIWNVLDMYVCMYVYTHMLFVGV